MNVFTKKIKTFTEDQLANMSVALDAEIERREQRRVLRGAETLPHGMCPWQRGRRKARRQHGFQERRLAA